ncbi:MAG: ATP cone domain-containing protein, partial [Pseudomonadota bacterium]|nr:ATP cone domain-containing protein [Pseudomonadota bacterium]
QETTDLSYPRVIKNDKSTEVFSEQKITKSIYIALEKRQVSADEIDKALQNILNRCITQQEKEISTSKIGEFVMQELLALDHVAYIRYASVYLSFNEIDAFKKLVDNLKDDLSPEMKKLQKKLLNED